MRSGILAAGNFIIDYVKLIDAYPAQDTLATISHETSSNGGGPYNVLKDLSFMKASYPLEAAGVLGKDANGQWILEDCAKAGIETCQLKVLEGVSTSYTDAMTVVSTGRRTFFHQRGANAKFSECDVDFTQSQAKHFHLGYLMLLDTLDEFVSDEEKETRASKLLEKARAAGLTTSVDIVSTENPKFRKIAEAALPHTDVLIINELEAGKIAGLQVHVDGKTDLEAVKQVAQMLLTKGVRQWVVIHFVEGSVVATSEGIVTQASLQLPQSAIAGATGAGDAFAAGFLHGFHEGWSVQDCLNLAVCTAACCLSDPTPSLGMKSVDECLLLGEKYGYRDL